MKTTVLLLFCLICSCLSAYAQDAKRAVLPDDRRWLLTIAAGTNIDLSGSSANPYSELLGSRPEAVAMVKYRLTHLASRKIGWYADIQFNLHYDRRSEYLQSLAAEGIFAGLIEAFVEGFGEMFAFMHPSLGGGLVYRIEHGRWKIHPEAGLGYGVYLFNREKSKTIEKYDIEHHATYKQRASSWYMDVGLSANYFVTRRCFFALNAGFRQPLQRSYAEFVRTENNVEVERLRYETSRIGRSLNLSLGFGFTVGKKR